jgi:sugar porter (SP) family MFS transporter
MSNAYIGTLHLGASEWRWELGVSGIPAVLFLVTLFFIPRSPRWLVTQNREDEALKVLQLTSATDAVAELRRIRRALDEEEAGGSEDSLLSARYRKPVIIAITVGMFSQLSGINAVLYYLNDIFTLAGASKFSANLQAIAVGATNLVATLLAMSIIDKFGRKKLLLSGTVGLLLCLSAIGYCFYTHRHLNLLVYLVMAFIACFAVSQGAVVWVYMSEVFPTKLRARGQSLGSSSHWISNALISLVFPLLAQHSGAAPFFFFAAMMVVDLVLVFTYYPETARVTLESMQDAIRIH